MYMYTLVQGISFIRNCVVMQHSSTHASLIHYVFVVEDLERNNGHDKPYFMSKNLMKLLNAKNFKSDHTDGDEISMETVQT